MYTESLFTVAVVVFPVVNWLPGVVDVTTYPNESSPIVIFTLPVTVVVTGLVSSSPANTPTD